jgi:hypothetical protein
MMRKYNPVKVDLEMVRSIGLGLTGVKEGTAYGLPALKVDGKLLACVPANRSAEPEGWLYPVYTNSETGIAKAGEKSSAQPIPFSFC